MKKTIEKLYDDLKVILYRLHHITLDFQKDFEPKSEIEQELKERVIQGFEGALSGCFNLSDMLYSLMETSDENEIKEFLASSSEIKMRG